MLPGDADGNGTCNGGDLNTVLSNYNRTVPLSYAGWTMGDFDGNGTVNGGDLNTVLSNYNQTREWVTTAVPEPSTLLLTFAALVGLSTYVVRRRRT